MKIDSQTTLKDIQQTFSTQFPHLRLEFYNKPHGEGEATSNRAQLEPDQKVAALAKSGHPDQIDVAAEMTISHFESMVEKHFGLHVQVFRRSGNLWLQTTATDGWSLEQANRKGGHSERLYHEQSENSEL